MTQFILSLAIPLVLTILLIDVLPIIIGKRRKKKASKRVLDENEEAISFDGPFLIAIKKFRKSRIGMISLHVFVFLML